MGVRSRETRSLAQLMLLLPASRLPRVAPHVLLETNLSWSWLTSSSACLKPSEVRGNESDGAGSQPLWWSRRWRPCHLPQAQRRCIRMRLNRWMRRYWSGSCSRRRRRRRAKPRCTSDTRLLRRKARVLPLALAVAELPLALFKGTKGLYSQALGSLWQVSVAAVLTARQAASSFRSAPVTAAHASASAESVIQSPTTHVGSVGSVWMVAQVS